MGAGTVEEPRLSAEPEVDAEFPWPGLREVLRNWTGRGQLMSALALPAPEDPDELRWSRRDVERRANRIAFEQLSPLLSRLPKRAGDWLEAVPATTWKETVLRSAPTAGVDWGATRLHGWPPDSFVIRERRRGADPLPVAVLAWAAPRVERVATDAASLDPTLSAPLRDRMRAMTTAAEDLIGRAEGRPTPTAQELRDLTRLGQPWSALATVCVEIIALDRLGLEDLARRVVLPSLDLRWRLFHLAVFGELLRWLRAEGWALENLRPLSGSATNGPSFRALAASESLDLWFEGSGLWTYYGHTSPYRELTKGAFVGSTRALGADIVVLGSSNRALVLECKYGAADYVGRSGYSQTVTYAEELRNAGHDVIGLTIGPDDVIAQSALAEIGGMMIGFAGPRHLATLLDELL